jgi:holo-[acyl-carrier protein] synthase
MAASITNGIDIVEIRRIREIDPKIRQRFYQRVFTEAEISEAKESANSLAGKFAGKEAAAKALGCGIGEVTWHQLEILSDEFGKPILYFHERALAVAKKNHWTSWSISITHVTDYALAFVTALMDKPSGT